MFVHSLDRVARPAASLPLISLLVLALLVSLWPTLFTPRATRPEPGVTDLPLSFIPNAGQRPAPVLMESRAMGGTLFFERDGVRLELPGARFPEVRLEFLGARPTTALRGEGRLPGVANFYVGSDPAGWHEGLPTYGEIVYTGLYPGIDLWYSGASRRLKGTYLVAPGADPSRIRWRYQGAHTLEVDPASGDLRVALGAGEDAPRLTEAAPVAWQERDGRRVPVAVAFALAPDGSVAFALPEGYDATMPLVLDPTLAYSSYFGGDGYEQANAIAVDSSGNSYMTGATNSTNFPGQPNPRLDVEEVWVSKVNAAGSAVLYTTYLMGNGSDDEGFAIAVDTQGNAYVTGETDSTNFPTRNPAQAANAGGRDMFISKLGPGGTLQYSTYVGTAGWERGDAIAVDGAGRAYVTGDVFVSDEQLDDVLVIKLSPAGNVMEYAIYFGGRGNDRGTAIAVEPGGHVWVAGVTGEGSINNYFLFDNNFYTSPDAIQPACGRISTSDCADDGFLTRISPDGSQLVYSSYLGGGWTDMVRAIALDGQGNIYLTGETTSVNFPTTAAHQPSCQRAGPGDWMCRRETGFVTKLAQRGTQLVYSTYLGGWDYDWSRGIAADAQGNAYVAGFTNSTDFPTRDAFQPRITEGYCTSGTTADHCDDIFVSKFGPTGALIWSSYLGGQFHDRAYGVALGPNGLYLTGESSSINFPAVNALQPDARHHEDAILVRITDGAGTPPPPPPPPGSHRINIPFIQR